MGEEAEVLSGVGGRYGSRRHAETLSHCLRDAAERNPFFADRMDDRAGRSGLHGEASRPRGIRPVDRWPAVLAVARIPRIASLPGDPDEGGDESVVAVAMERGQDADALAALQAAERLAGRLAAPHPLARPIRLWLIRALVRLGETESAEQVIAGLGEERGQGEVRIALAILRLAQDDPDAALAALAPVLAGTAPVGWQPVLAEAFLLEAIARDALGDEDAADQALEHALDRAEPDGMVLGFLVHPAPSLLERHTRHRTAHAALIAEIQDRLAGHRSVRPPAAPRPPLEPLRQSELRVLRYLPTNLTAPEIATELYVSLNTVKTHTRNLDTKLGTHHRAEAVARARALGLLAPSALGARLPVSAWPPP